MRIAVYGFIGEHSGSLASGHTLVLKELLRRGHTIDLFAIEGFIGPDTLDGIPGFQYMPVGHAGLQLGWGAIAKLPSALRRAASVVFSIPSNRLHYRALQHEILRRSREARYDAVAVLGLLSPFSLPDLHTVSWSQGTVNGEAGWFVRNAHRLVRHRSGHLLPGIAMLYLWKMAEARSDLAKSDRVLCGSEWAIQSWADFGVERNRLAALPYPIDLEFFRESPIPGLAATTGLKLLHAGRLVPRKRLDLLLEGFALFRRDNPDASLRIVGGFSYAPGYERLLHDPKLTAGVEYVSSVSRDRMPDMYGEAHAVVQPSEHENFGSAVAEALACGRPVLVGPTNGTKDYISPSCVTFAEYTPASVAAGMTQLAARIMSDATRVSIEARRAAEAHFSIMRISDQLEASLRARS